MSTTTVTKTTQIQEDLQRQLDTIDDMVNSSFPASCSDKYKAMYTKTLGDGLRGLLGQLPKPESPQWAAAMAYGRSVIASPEDSVARASSSWVAGSTSDIYDDLLGRYGQPVLDAAKAGCRDIIDNHFHGRREAVAHVDKKASFLRHFKDVDPVAGFHPASSFLAYGCLGVGTMTCSLVTAGWTTIETSIKIGMIAHVGICEDYGTFTDGEYDVRTRMVALAAGAGHYLGDRATRAFVDASCLKAVGANDQARSMDAAASWRVISGGTTLYGDYDGVHGSSAGRLGFVAPEVMMMLHDLLDWRSDVAAGNWENSVTAVHGLGIPDAFHSYVEHMLRRILDSPVAGLHAIAGIMHLHFVVTRYGAWNYRGRHGPPCAECVGMCREATRRAGMEWSPRQTPQSFEDTAEFRRLAKLWMERFEDHGLVQLAVSWFQHLISSGQIWLFNVFEDGTSQVDCGTGWA